MEADKIFVAGIPRSGTTWLAKVLGEAPEHKYVHEPDNERHTYTGFYYKRGLGRFPYLDKNDKCERYLRLFQQAFFGSHIAMESHFNTLLFRLGAVNKEKIRMWLQEDLKNPEKLCPESILYPLLPKDVSANDEKRVVKSVHAGLSLPLILEEFAIRTIIIVRHPASVISSYLRLNNRDMDRKLYLNKKLKRRYHDLDLEKYRSSPALVRAGLQIGILYDNINETLKKYPSIKLVFHEELCLSPVDGFKEIYEYFELNWNAEIEKYIKSNNTQGSGYETKRVAKENIDIWKRSLTDEQISEIRKGYSVIDPKFYRDFL